MNFKIVRINSEYCGYLRQFDDKVFFNTSIKSTYSFVGIIFKINDFEYFAPLVCPKEKHKNMKNMIDFLKIQNGELGVINFNNMIPVMFENYTLVELHKENINETEEKYLKLLQEQLNWLNSHFIQVRNKSNKLYNLYMENQLPENIRKRCCNFELLEEKCLLYNEKNIVKSTC